MRSFLLDGSWGGEETGQLTLVDVLRARAASNPEGWAYSFLADGEREEDRLTWGGLDRRARAIAAALEAGEAHGKPVLLLFPPGLELITAFFGCLYAGAVAVPSYPPSGRSAPRLRSILLDASPCLILASSTIAARWPGGAGDLGAAAQLPLLVPAELEDGAAEGWHPCSPEPGDVAFLQYTSGSTSDPKGVMVTHGNLVHNQVLIRDSCRHDEGSTFVSWLPMYHDMGLIGCVLQPLFVGAPCVLMSPLAFLQKPERWLRAVDRYKAHTSGAPNFAYDLCVRRIPPERRGGLDLSTWRVAFNGAEPVHAATLDAFTGAFASCGFRREAFFPCYGLAEATLIVSGRTRAEPPMTRRFRGLDEGLAIPGEDGGALVASGEILAGQRLALIDPATGEQVDGGRIGEIWVSGPSVALGYWRRPEQTARDFGARLPGDDTPFLRTGDLGFLSEGRLFVTGRLKDLIIVRGRNLYPQDVERTAESSHPAARPGGGAAFALDLPDGEGMALVQEVDPRQVEEQGGAILDALRRAVAEEHGVALAAVALVRPGTVPKTTSGKLQRQLCRRLFLEGALVPLAEWRSSGEEEPADLAAAAAVAPGEVASWLSRRVARHLGVEPSAIAPERSLAELGLDSIQAIELVQAVAAELAVEIPLDVFLGAPSLAALAGRIEALLAAPPVATAEAASGDLLPLDPGVRGLWLLQRVEPSSPAYNIVGAARIVGAVDDAALGRALEALAARHPALRSTFPAPAGDPRQRIAPAGGVDFTRAATELSGEDLLWQLSEEACRPFDLERGPLFRARRLDAPDGERFFLLAVHHIIADLWSMAVLLDDLGALYAAATGAASPSPATQLALPPPPVKRGEEAAESWRRRLEGYPALLDLPADRAPALAPRHRAGGCRLELDAAAAEGLRTLARGTGATLFVALLSGYLAWLHRVTGRERLVVGTPSADRGRPESARQVGYFVQPTAIPSDAVSDPGFAAFLERTRSAVLESLRDGLPLPLLVEAVKPERDPARHPLFQTVLALQKAPLPAWNGLAAFALGEAGARLGLGGLQLQSVSLPEVPGPFDLALLVAELDGRLAASLQVDLDLFDRATGERLARQIASLLAAAAGEPGRHLSDLPLLGSGERWQVLAEWNDTAQARQAPRSVPERVRDVARETPRAVAVAREERGVTYRELVRRSAGLAAHLRRLGIAPEDRVAVVSERSPEMVVGLLAVLEAGGAYVPIDPASPAERVAWLLRDSGARAVLAQPALVAALPPEVPVLSLEAGTMDGPEPTAAGPIDLRRLAYVVYTSGSTGLPKGVQVSHWALANLVDWHLQTFGLTATDVASHLAGAAFDASVWEIWTCLSAGARLELPSDEARTSPSALRSWLTGRGVTTAFVPTPMAHELLALEGFGAEGSLRLLLTGGDELRARPRPSGRFRLWNNYGPTEGTVVATSGPVAPDGAGAPDLGRPIRNVRLHLLDVHLRPVPPGVPGEVALAGAGLARGYLGRPDLTAERFVPDPLAGEPGERLYRTGDLARWRPDGTLAFLGRIDAQVQVRGFRVEPAEVETALRLHPGVTGAVVLAPAGPGGERRLVAFVSGSATPAELREFLSRRLPASLVPSRFVLLDTLPWTANGKVDRRALLALAEAAPEPSPAAAPGGAAEEVVAALLAEALGREAVAVHDDFFELGGHSLLAARVAARLRETLGVEVPLRRIFESPTAAGIAAAVELELRAGRRLAEPPVPRLAGGDAPLTSGQERLWFLDRLQPGAAYNVPLEARLEGALSLPALAAALAELERRHEALRSTFPQVDGGPVQRVLAAGRPDLPLVDLSALDEPARGGEADRLAREEAGRPFDLSAGPVARRRLLRLAESGHRLLWTLHHIVCDGRSLEILLEELAVLYAAALVGRRSPLPAPPLQLADVASWERQRLAGPGLDEPLRYWERKLAEVSPLELPADRPRPAARSARGGTRTLPLTGSMACSAAALARRERTTPFLLLLAVYAAQIHRWGEQRDVTVGAPAAGRGHAGLDRVVGFLVNTIALRIEVERDLPFRELLARVRRCGVEAFGHADLPFEKVVERLHPERALSVHPVFQVTFALRPAPAPVALPGGLELVPRGVDTGAAKLDLGLSVDWSEEGLTAALEYAADLFDAATADRLLAGFVTLLTGVLEEPERTVGGLPLLPEAERREVLAAWGDRSSPPPACVHAEVAAWAERSPDALALEEEGGRLTYGELDARAGAVAGRLRDAGVGPDVVVAVLTRRGALLVTAVLGVLKAGGAYAPLDPSTPAERLAALLESAGTPVVLVESALLPLLPPGYAAPVVDLGAAAAAGGSPPDLPMVAPENLAYLIFTSGSTGVPKAVALTHGGLAHMAAWVRQSFALGPGERGTQVATPAFDASVLEIWPVLSAGASLHLCPEGERLSPAGLVAWMADRRVTVAFLPTPLAELALAEPWPEESALRILSTGGDRLRRRREERHPFALFNLYGPSEVTVFISMGEVRTETPGRTPTIGRAVGHVRAAVLDAGLEPVPLGVPGELCAGGIALARGYLGRPDLTAERFVPDPHSTRPGERLYRTGDRVRLLPDGELDFLGRRDHQVKLRGMRFEIGEVEAALGAHPEVREAVAELRADPKGEPRLVAWVAGLVGAPAAAGLRAALRDRLPAYMIPSALVPIPRLPLTGNGKIDRRALPEPDWSRPELSGEYVAPRSAVETLLAKLWAELLEVERVGVHDSFFELGGHSLKAARLVTRLRETFGVELPVQTVFEAPTVAAMSVAIAVHLVSRSDPRTRAHLRTDVEQRAHP